MQELSDSDDGLAVDLALLTEAVNDPSLDLAASLRRLVAELSAAFPSLAGLTVLLGGDTAYSITTLPARSTVRSSLLIPLRATAPGTALVLFASSTRAFQAQLAEFARVSGTGSAALVVDRHLSAGSRSAMTRTVQAASWVNQAIGVLIGLGATPEAAWAALRATAAETGQDEVSAAIDILARLLE